MKQETEPTLMAYAAENRSDPFWEDVYQIIRGVVSRITCGMCRKPVYDDDGHRIMELTDDGNCDSCQSLIAARIAAKKIEDVIGSSDVIAPAIVVPETRAPYSKTKHRCVVCGGTFLSVRSDAKYCSGRCRVRSARRGGRAEARL